MSNPYTEKFRKLPLHRLVGIITLPADFDLEAVEAARLELERREVPEEDIASIRNGLSERIAEEQKFSEKLDAQKSKAKSFILTWFRELFDPHNEKSLSRRLSVIKIILGILALAGLWQNWQLFTYSLDGPVYVMAMVAFEVFLFPLAVLLFILKKRAGWVLLNFWLIYSSVYILVSVGLSLFSMFHWSVSYLLRALLFIGLLIYLNRSYVRELCGIQVRLQKAALISSVSLVLLYTLGVIGFFYWSNTQIGHPGSPLRNNEIRSGDSDNRNRISTDELPMAPAPPPAPRRDSIISIDSQQ